MRLLPLEQRVIEDLARWYGPPGSKRYRAALRALPAWLVRLRLELESGRQGDWELCEEREHERLAGCWRAYFSPWDKPTARGGVAIAAGGHDDRIIVEVLMHQGEPSVRVLAVGPKYAGSGEGREAWVYRQADRRRQRPYGQKGGR